MKTEGQIEAKYMQIETMKERGLLDLECAKGYQKALEWVLKGDIFE